MKDTEKNGFVVPKKIFGIFGSEIFTDLPSLFGFYGENSVFPTVEDGLSGRSAFPPFSYM